MHFIYDEYTVISYLRRYVHLFRNCADVVYGIVGCGVEFDYIIGITLIYRPAGIAVAACLSVGSGTQTIDSLCKNTGTRRLAHTAGTAEQICLCKPLVVYSVFKRVGERFLTYDC